MMRKYDYIIVGQGLAGSVLAWKLLSMGKKILVVSNENYAPASSIAAGMFNPLVFKRVTKSWKTDELLPELQLFFTGIEKETNQEIIDFRDIIKPLNEGEDQLWRQKMEQDELKKYIKSIDKEKPLPGLKDFFSFARVSGAGRVNLEKFLKLTLLKLKDKGAYVNVAFVHTDLIIKQGSVIWNNHEARKIVFCEGPYAVKNPYFDNIVFYLTKGDVLLLKSKGLSEGFILSKQVFILPVGNQHFLSGSTYNWSDVEFNPVPVESDRELLEKKINDIINCDFRVVDHRCGIRPTIKDRRPVLGRHREYGHMFYFNGLGTKGVMLAPFFANEMIGLMENNKEVNQEVKIERFYS